MANRVIAQSPATGTKLKWFSRSAAKMLVAARFPIDARGLSSFCIRHDYDRPKCKINVQKPSAKVPFPFLYQSLPLPGMMARSDLIQADA